MVVYHQIAQPSKNCRHLKEPFRGLLGSCDSSERPIDPKYERSQRPQPDRVDGGRRMQRAAVDAASEFQLRMGAVAAVWITSKPSVLRVCRFVGFNFMAWGRGCAGRIEACHSVGDAVVFCRSDRGCEFIVVSDFGRESAWTSNVSTMKNEASFLA